MNEGLVLLVVLFVVYALISRWLARSSITGPMLFTAAGLIGAWDVFGRAPIEAFDMLLESGTVQVLLEATLVILLFSDAVLIDFRAVRAEATIPSRLLGIGLPLTIAFGTLGAMLLFPDLGFWPAAVIAVILAPTDAALGQAVVANRAVPDAVRQGLSVESGLNDGIAVPFLTISIAGAASEMQTGGEIITIFLEEIGFAIVVGLVVGAVGAWLLRQSSKRGWMAREGRQVVLPFLALLAFAIADPIGGSGFIAAFVGGLTFGRFVRGDYPDIARFSEGMAHLLTMASFFIFGALILAPSLEVVTLQAVGYAVLSLTVIRMIPVALALTGMGAAGWTKAYIGWFGPRGLASLVFAGTVIVDSPQQSSEFVIMVVAITVAMSVFLHGASAWPLSNAYARWFTSMAEEEDMEAMPEAQEVEHMPHRRVARQMAPPMPNSGDVTPM